MGYSINKTDVAGLRFLYKTDAVARYVLESLAKRQNNWKITTISSLFSIYQLAGFEITRKDIIRTARELEKMNYCEFILGKVAGSRNEQSRIVWKIPPGNVGRIAVSKI